MTEEAREELRQCLVPVVLDHGFSAHRIAARLRNRLEAEAILCGNRKNLWDFVHPFCSFFRLFRESDERLAAEQLRDLAERSPDCLFWLIPVTERDFRFLQSYAEQLEPYFVCVFPSQLETMGLGSPKLPNSRICDEFLRKAKS